MATTRLGRWNEPLKLLLIPFGPDDDFMKLIDRKLEQRTRQKNATLVELVESAREIIFDSSGQTPSFHVIGYRLNTDTFQLLACPSFTFHPQGENVDAVDNEVMTVLGLALGFDVPVFPNTEAEAPVLAHYYRELMIHGFTMVRDDGVKFQCSLEFSPGERIDSFSHLEGLDHTRLHPAGELVLIQRAIKAELSRRDEAARVLANLRLAVSDLEAALQNPGRNEHALQRCLEDHPILFGPDYARIIPKHRLGSEYEMDYALVRVSGLIDLVEIESSSLKLFTAKGDPTSFLVHAEQQVLNWLAWIERNAAYARENLPNVMRPVGYVVIGRTSSLSAGDLQRLSLRNAVFAPALQIMTYDDVLDRAKNLLRLLGTHSTASG